MHSFTADAEGFCSTCGLAPRWHDSPVMVHHAEEAARLRGEQSEWWERVTEVVREVAEQLQTFTMSAVRSRLDADDINADLATVLDACERDGMVERFGTVWRSRLYRTTRSSDV